MDEYRSPQIALVYVETMADKHFEEFETEVRFDGLDLRVESRPVPGPYAGIEWLIPTAVVVFITRSYFDSFLKEAGKDHYAILKAAILKVSSKYFGKDAPKGRLVFTKGKAESEDPRYSIFYSVVAELGSGFRVKLLLQSDFDVDMCNAAQEAFLKFLTDAYDGTLNIKAIHGLDKARPVAGTLLLAYNSAANVLEVVDPMGGKATAGPSTSSPG